jgi:hypothetical protein
VEEEMKRAIGKKIQLEGWLLGTNFPLKPLGLDNPELMEKYQ